VETWFQKLAFKCCNLYRYTVVQQLIAAVGLYKLNAEQSTIHSLKAHGFNP
jgi:hypothetical protein